MTNNLTTTFLAEGVTPVAAAAPESNEDIRVHLTPLEQVSRLIETGGFVQALHVAPLLMVLLRRARGGR